MSVGSLFNTKRLVRSQFEEYKKEVFSILEKNNIEYFSPRYYDNKETFGDLDIIVKKPFGRNEIFEIFNFNKSQFNNNGSVNSICYKGFQIDFITASSDKFEITKFYYTWAEFSILVGILFKKFDITFGMDGLSYKYEVNINGVYKKIGDVYLSNNPQEIIEFLGLDYSVFVNGFKTSNELYAYVSSSKYFNPAYFKLNPEKKYRRPEPIQGIIEFTKNSSTHYPNFDIYSKVELHGIIDSFFRNVNFSQKLIMLKNKENLISTNSKKFNGDIVYGITRLKGIELGKFMEKFKVYAYQNYGFVDFNEYVYNTKEFNIIKDIEHFHKQGY